MSAARNGAREAALQHFGFRSRTLLTNVTGFAEILSDPAADFPPSKRFEYAEIVRASAAVLQDETELFLEVLSRSNRDGEL